MPTEPQTLSSNVVFSNVKPGLLLFIFDLSKQLFYFNMIRTQIVGVEGKHGDHLTTVVVKISFSIMTISLSTNDPINRFN